MTRSGWALCALALSACDASFTADLDVDDAAPRLVHDQPEVPPVYADAAGQPIDLQTPPDTEIYKAVPTDPPILAPVLAPDGSHITWGEFRIADGSVVVTCRDGGTELDFELEGLVPGGLYTAWLVFFEAPGFAEIGFDALIGVSPAGRADGSDNVFRAEADGDGALSTIAPPDPVSIALQDPFDVPECLLDAYEVHLVVAYHIDGQSHGPFPGPEATVAEHLGFPLLQGEEVHFGP